MSEPQIVHPVSADEFDGWMRSFRAALLAPREGPEAEAYRNNRRRLWRPDFTWGVRDRGAWVGSLIAEPRTLTVPGPGGIGSALIAADAVTAVSVAATHRRRGLLRRMITQSLRAAVERGDPVSVLVAAEWGIYGRYGYAPAVAGARYTYHSGRPAAAPAGGPPTGVRQVDTAELGAVATDVFERARRLRSGQMDRADPWWPRNLGLDGFSAMVDRNMVWVLREDADGRPDGLLGWRVTRDFELDGTAGTAAVEHLVAASDEAYRELWAYLAGVDLIGEFDLDQRPVDEPVRWLLGDGRALQQRAQTDELWLRLLDVPAALSARGYALDGRVVLDVVGTDTDADAANAAAGAARYGVGRAALEVVDGVGHCEPTTAAPELRITRQALASAYLGAHRLGTLAVTGAVTGALTELTPGALVRADLMFATSAAPWNQTPF